MSKTRFTLFFYLFINHLLLSQYVQGLDVSNWQGSINWNEVNTDGQVYAWSKATEGMTYQDPQFINNMINGLDAGVIMGAYHFARPDNNLATEDATNFLNHAAPYIGSGFLPPVLDLENPYSGGQTIVLSNLFTSSELSNWVLEWMNTIETQTGIAPIIYVNGNYANYLSSGVTNFGLWFAQPDELLTPPVNIGAWNDWQFKQYSWWGEVAGIIGDVDLNMFNGSMTEFNELIGINTTQITSSAVGCEIFIYPNPVIDQIHIKGHTQSIVDISVCSSDGKTQALTLFNNYVIDASGFLPGLYILKITNDQGHVLFARFVKK